MFPTKSSYIESSESCGVYGVIGVNSGENPVLDANGLLNLYRSNSLVFLGSNITGNLIIIDPEPIISVQSTVAPIVVQCSLASRKLKMSVNPSIIFSSAKKISCVRFPCILSVSNWKRVSAL
jgi:hypothetical protein